jgi:hypothetical protein
VQKTSLKSKTLSLGLVALTAVGMSCTRIKPLPRTPVPDEPTTSSKRVDKPLPVQPPPPVETAAPAPPFDDPPIITQEAPETPAFIAAYKAVNQPSISVAVNRPAQGAFDDATARAVDYEAIQNLLAEFLRSDGRVRIIAALEAGKPVEADIVVRVIVRPAQKTEQGQEVRILCEAVNSRGGELIASAAEDVPPPLTKANLDRYTRYVGRRLIDGMAKTWTLGPPPAARVPEVPPTPVIPPPPGDVPKTDAPAPLPPPGQEPPASSIAPAQPSTMPER